MGRDMNDNGSQRHIWAIGFYCDEGFVLDYLFDDVTKASQFLIALKMQGKADDYARIIRYEINLTK